MQSTMVRDHVTKEEFLSEVSAMVSVCFEGNVKEYADGVLVTLNNGQRFFLEIITEG